MTVPPKHLPLAQDRDTLIFFFIKTCSGQQRRKSQYRGSTFPTHTNHDTHSCTARAIDSAVEPVSLTLSKVTFGRSSSSLSLLICLGDRPLGSVCAVRTGHRHGSQWEHLCICDWVRVWIPHMSHFKVCVHAWVRLYWALCPPLPYMCNWQRIIFMVMTKLKILEDHTT